MLQHSAKHSNRSQNRVYPDGYTRRLKTKFVKNPSVSKKKNDDEQDKTTKAPSYPLRGAKKSNNTY